MSRQLAFVIAGVAAVIGVLLVVHLWRWSRAHPGQWGAAQSLTALGLVVSLLAVMLPLVTANGGEDPAVATYRQRVSSTCASLQASTNPLMDAMNSSGSIDRARLEKGLRNQVKAAEGAVATLWRTAPPDALADASAAARQSADAFFRTMNGELDRMSEELPRTASLQQVSAYFGSLDAAVRPAASEFAAAMTELAGKQCGVTTAPAG
ncbi:hypothetical protein N865_01795 [Intrasporangium oryzae NRRL B-24470]|uniref:Uncharacterized protein n=1 Tax=Intrasporangium oryzae NRRL B-24470 TaxID=1386089 RepID=W9GEG9_9MICO|nr:hypothetical protein [Intrasporangium oryzae]EWT03223.1 hypothetical protein N865_01795 [Intrasporangium oryzae NRRL B-24470]